MTIANLNNATKPSQTNNGKNVGDLLATFGSSNRLLNGDGKVTEVANLIRSIFEEEEKESVGASFRVTSIGRQLTGTYGTVAVWTEVLINTTPTIIACVMPIEATREGSNYQHAQINGSEIEIFKGINEANTAQLANIVSTEIKKQNAGRQVEVFIGGFLPIYREVTLTKENITPLVHSAVSAIEYAQHMADPDREVFKLKDYCNSRISLQCRTELDREVTKASGLPVRSDIYVDLVATNKVDPNDQLTQSNEWVIGSASAYVDLRRVDVSIRQLPYMGMGLMGPVYKHQPIFVLTRQGVNTPKSSLEFTLMSIANAVSLTKNQAYGIVWRNTFGANANQNRNLGAIGHQIPGLSSAPEHQGMCVPVQVDGDATEVMQLMARTIEPTPAIAIEVEQGGPDNWAVEVFSRVAANESDYAQRLIMAANNLTGNHFSEFFPSNGNIIITQLNEIGLTGYYTKDGRVRDIREIDLLALLNITEGRDPALIQAYEETKNPSIDINIRMDSLRRVYQAVVKDVVIKAYTERYYFAKEFLDALAQAIIKCGISYRNDSSWQNGTQPQYVQSVDIFAQASVNTQVFAGLFNNQHQATGLYQTPGQIFTNY